LPELLALGLLALDAEISAVAPAPHGYTSRYRELPIVDAGIIDSIEVQQAQDGEHKESRG